MEYNDQYTVQEKRTTGYKFKIKLAICTEPIQVTLQRSAFSGRWEMKWNQKLPLYMIAILIRTIFDIEGLEIECLVITLPAFSKEQKQLCFSKNKGNEVSGYADALMHLAPDETIF